MSVAATLLVATLSILFKLQISSGKLLPGLDGAYYWVQVRTLLERGTLAFSDLPMVFWIQGGFVWLARFITGQDLDVLIPLVVRLSDAILPILSVIPIVVFAKQYNQKVWLAPIFAAAVLFHPIQLFYFTGDFIKNEAALPFALLLGVLMLEWKSGKIFRVSFAMAIVLAVTAITHFGVLILCVVMLAFWVGAFIWQMPFKRIVITTFILLGVAVLAGGLLFWLSPSRFDRLLSIVLDPSIFFSGSIWQIFMSNPYLVRAPILFALVTGQLGTLILGGLALWQHKHIPLEVRPALFTFLTSAFLFSSPFIGILWADRLIALSFVPLALGAALLWITVPHRKTAFVVRALAIVTLLFSLILSPSGATSPALSDVEWKEFQHMTSTITLDENSLVISPHGLEFLAAWNWRTDVVQDQFGGAEFSQGYQSVYVLLYKPNANEQDGQKGSVTGQNSLGVESNGLEGYTLYESATFQLFRLP